jgi:hypothetical protein
VRTNVINSTKLNNFILIVQMFIRIRSPEVTMTLDNCLLIEEDQAGPARTGQVSLYCKKYIQGTTDGLGCG